MAANRWQRMIATLCVVSLVLSSCTALQTVSIPSGESPPSLPGIKVGDTVVITTRTTEKKTFTVTAVEADALVGKGVRVAYADMATLSVKRIRKGATTAVVVAIIFSVLLVVAAHDTAKAFDDIYNSAP